MATSSEPGGWRPTPLAATGSAPDVIADQIRMAVISGSLPANERLPGETELARQFNVSRGTVREALRQLASQSLIHTTRGVQGGSFVTHPTPFHIQRSLGTSLSILVGSDVATVEWMHEARELLEIPAAGLAALRHHAVDLEAIEASLDADAVEETAPAETLHGFHAAVIKATGNTMLEIMLRPMFDVLDTKLAEFRFTPGFMTEVDQHHRRIADAIRSRDADAAEREMMAHLTQLRGHYEVLWQVDASKSDAGDATNPLSAP